MKKQAGQWACTHALRQALLGGVGLAIAACSGAHEPAHVPAAGQPRGSVAATANVPALLGASIDGLRHRLGAPQSLPADFRDPLRQLADPMTQLDSAAAFRLGGFLLVANYDARTRQVYDLLLLGHHEDSLMSRASLRANASEYLVLPVFKPGSNTKLLGLRVVPTN